MHRSIFVLNASTKSGIAAANPGDRHDVKVVDHKNDVGFATPTPQLPSLMFSSIQYLQRPGISKPKKQADLF
jgi:hypothetical protein